MCARGGWHFQISEKSFEDYRRLRQKPADGEETRTCARCGETETRPIPALGHEHTLTKTDRVEPTCTEEGTEAYWTCTACGKLFSDEDGKTEIEAPAAIAALGHDWNAWVTTREPTATTDGEQTRTCARCGATETRVLAATGDDDDDDDDIGGGTAPIVIRDPDVPLSGPTTKVSGLNTVDHMAYVIGFEDGTVRPDNLISRAETATMLYRLLTPERRDQIFTASAGFTDVTPELWYNKAVASLTRGGYINGYEDGTFRPDQAISRAEAMAILNRVLDRGVEGEPALEGIRTFPDNVKDMWYYFEVIEASNDHGHKGQRPNETWVAKDFSTGYDIDYYERP
ncbi:MAG: hypothetical protein E7423_07925 [Ruminococcaceae bacterium]|nr:hypothetical protein [Oscillospiraceae bacterium]